MADTPPTIVHPLPGLPGVLGIRVHYARNFSRERPSIVATLPVAASSLNPAGTVHAATIVALADTACGYGCLASLAPGKSGFTTIELKSNFLGAATAAETLATTASAVHLGATTQVWDATVTVERQGSTRAVAMFRCTQFLLAPSTSHQH